jgi:hypothetical protein
MAAKRGVTAILPQTLIGREILAAKPRSFAVRPRAAVSFAGFFGIRGIRCHGHPGRLRAATLTGPAKRVDI